MRQIRNATRTTKMVVAAVAAVIVFASTYGFAASLGLSSSGLGAGSSVVAACGWGITASDMSTGVRLGDPGLLRQPGEPRQHPRRLPSKSYRIQLRRKRPARWSVRR